MKIRLIYLYLFIIFCFVSCKSLEKVVLEDTEAFMKFSMELDNIDFNWGKIEDKTIKFYHAVHNDDIVSEYAFSHSLNIDNEYLKFISSIKKEGGFIFFIESCDIAGYSSGVIYTSKNTIDYYGIKKIRKINANLYCYEGYISPIQEEKIDLMH